jgi:hypothetical protein
MNKELFNDFRKQCIVREQRGTTAFNSYMVDRFDTEKFAELIVKECKNIVLDMMNKGQGDFDTLDQVLTEINENFGVAE